MGNKIVQWIDHQTYKVTFKIVKRYFNKVDGSRPHFYADVSFYPWYLLRLLLIAVKFLLSSSTKKYKLFTEDSVPGRVNTQWDSTLQRLSRWPKSIFGLTYFVKPTYTAQFYRDKFQSTNLSFKVSDDPTKVSILIIADHDNSATLECLYAIAFNLPKTIAVEIVVLSRPQSTPVQESLGPVTGITYLDLSTFKNISQALDKSIEKCNGEYICLLDSNTLVLENWLLPLLNTIEKNPSVALVGSKCLYPYGLLRDAGGIIYNDASTTKYGHAEDPSYAAYNFSREVDFCAATSSLFKKSEYLAAGGFDESYHALDDMIIDFCLSLRHRLKKKIYYQPQSSLVYFGLTETQPPTNQLASVSKWKDVLATYPSKDNMEQASRKYLPSETLVLIDSYLPRFDKESGSHRIFKLMEIFKSLGYHVVFIPKDGKAEHPYYEIITELGVETIVNYLGNARFKKDCTQASLKASVAWICRPRINQKFAFIKQKNPTVKWIYDTVDLHFVRIEREAKLLSSKRKMSRAKKYKKIEISLAKKADYTICITDVEQDILIKEGVTNTVVIPNIHEIANRITPDFNHRDGLLFIGSYEHTPNIDAVVWLINEIMPLIWTKNPDVKVTLLGSKPTPTVVALQSESVSVPGYIADVSPYFDNAKVFVAPLRYGAGMKGKIGQSLEFGLPIVSTNIGVEGMDLIPNHHVLVADEKNEFASQILQLYTSEKLWTHLKANSFDAIRKFTPEAVKEQIKDILNPIH